MTSSRFRWEPQFPGVTFSTSDGQENRIAFDFDFATGQYLITADIGGEVNGINSTILDFTLPVNDLTFLALGDNKPGENAMVDIYVGGEFTAVVPITVDGDFDVPDFVDLSAFTGVTKIEIWGYHGPGRTCMGSLLVHSGSGTVSACSARARFRIDEAPPSVSAAVFAIRNRQFDGTTEP